MSSAPKNARAALGPAAQTVQHPREQFYSGEVRLKAYDEDLSVLVPYVSESYAAKYDHKKASNVKYALSGAEDGWKEVRVLDNVLRNRLHVGSIRIQKWDSNPEQTTRLGFGVTVAVDSKWLAPKSGRLQFSTPNVFALRRVGPQTGEAVAGGS